MGGKLMKPYPNNPRTISGKRLNELEANLLKLGDLGGIVHNLETDEVIGGNQRTRVFVEGKTEIVKEFAEPDEQGTVAHGFMIWQGKRYAYRQVRWDEATAREANIKANIEAGQWNWEELANWSDDLPAWGLDADRLREWQTDAGALGLMLETEDENAGKDTEPQTDKAEELRQQWGVKLGQMWQLGQHRLICGDCTDKAVVERVMGGGEKAKIVISSPPYNSAIGGIKSDYYGKQDRFYKDKEIDKKTAEEWLLFCDSVLNNCAGIVFENSVVVWNVMYNANMRDGYGKSMFGGNHQFGVKETICWNKYKGFNISTKGILSRNWELVFVLSLCDEYFTTQQENEVRYNMWDIKTDDTQINGVHNAAFPVGLPEKALNWFSVNSDICYEPFSGSGTTLIACENLNRQCRAIEIDPGYCAVTLQRWADHTGQTPALLNPGTVE